MAAFHFRLSSVRDEINVSAVKLLFMGCIIDSEWLTKLSHGDALAPCNILLYWRWERAFIKCLAAWNPMTDWNRIWRGWWPAWDLTTSQDNKTHGDQRSCSFRVYYLSFFYFVTSLISSEDQTGQPIWTLNGTKDAVWRRKCFLEEGAKTKISRLGLFHPKGLGFDAPHQTLTLTLAADRK